MEAARIRAGFLVEIEDGSRAAVSAWSRWSAVSFMERKHTTEAGHRSTVNTSTIYTCCTRVYRISWYSPQSRGQDSLILYKHSLGLLLGKPPQGVRRVAGLTNLQCGRIDNYRPPLSPP